jgi:deoxyribonuclease-4
LRALDEADIAGMVTLMSMNGFGPLVAHAPYVYNVCAAKDDIRDRSIANMTEDLVRLEYIPGCLFNFHPGAHVGQGAEVGAEKIIEALDAILAPGFRTPVLLETMAGKGTEMGRSFEELARIIEGVKRPECVGVCLDTCHVWDGGYDVAGALSEVLDEFDRVVGLEKLRALHLNDSKNERSSHKDRHELLGEGYLGLEAFKSVVTEPRVAELPMILETPNATDAGYAAEIRALKALAAGVDVAVVARDLACERTELEMAAADAAAAGAAGADKPAKPAKGAKIASSKATKPRTSSKKEA